MPIEQRKIIGEIKAETQNIYTTAFIQAKEDVEKGFSFCMPTMIELQHKTIQFLTI